MNPQQYINLGKMIDAERSRRGDLHIDADAEWDEPQRTPAERQGSRWRLPARQLEAGAEAPSAGNSLRGRARTLSARLLNW